MSRGEPQRIDQVFAELFAKRGYARQLSAAAFTEAWAEAAGSGIASLSRPGALRRGVLEIVVENSALVQELTFQKRQLLASLGSRLPEQGIRDLRFRVGPIH